MSPMTSLERIRFLARRLTEVLWIRPLAMGLLSLGAVGLAELADRAGPERLSIRIEPASLEALLTVMASGMLVIATFAVASMVSAYTSVSNSVTPRSFVLVLADDLSQNALSTFLGAFIFSIVALSTVTNRTFGDAGRFTLFVTTLGVFALVVVMFVPWVDRIARLGRVTETIDQVERACAEALTRRRELPRLGGAPLTDGDGPPVYSATIGYVQHLDVDRLQAVAERGDLRIRVEALPGTFVAPGRPLVTLLGVGAKRPDDAEVQDCFVIGGARTFLDDPRFGLVVLAEIAARALSPAVNDPGTAIDVVGTVVRLLVAWRAEAPGDRVHHDRVEVPLLDVGDLFDDAFTAVARDGAGMLEVAVRLQKGLASLAATGDPDLRAAAVTHSRRALARAERAMALPDDLTCVREAAATVGASGQRA